MPHDDGLREVRDLARGLRSDRDEIGESVEELRDTVTELHREPRAQLELTEDELVYLEAIVASRVGEVVELSATPAEVAESVKSKLSQALAIESGPGGAFYDGGAAA